MITPCLRFSFLLLLFSTPAWAGWAQVARLAAQAEAPLPPAVSKRFPAKRFGIFVLANETRSPVAAHRTYRQMSSGRWLWPGSLRLTVAGERVLSLFPNQIRPLDSLSALPSSAAAPDPAHGAALARAYVGNRLRPSEQARAVIQSVEPIWYVSEADSEVDADADSDSAARRVHPGWLLTWAHPDTRIGAWEVVLDEATGRAAKAPRDLLIFHHAQQARRSPPRDTTVRALVFRPDPLTTAQQPYGRPYIDSLDHDRPALNQQRVLDTLRLTFAADSFRLQNPWFKVAEFDPPVRPVVAGRTAAALQFTRAEAGFQQVNAFFHLTEARRYLGALGFGTLHPQAIRVDASGLSGADQSRFSPVDTTLSFGEGGVDDAEDADVVVHEYLHALAFAAAPNTNVGLERRTLDEANADYWAAVHSARLGGTAAYGREQVFNWDGHNEFWAGRWVISPKRYPSDLQNSIYLDADIWSATLWQIRAVLPPAIADRLWLQHLYSYAPNLTMPQAAGLILQADTLLYGAAHADTIFYFFDQRHILGSHAVVGVSAENSAVAGPQVYATEEFAMGEAAVFRSLNTAGLTLSSITGAVVWRGRAVGGKSAPIPAVGLAPGVYLLRWQTATSAGAARLLRE